MNSSFNNVENQSYRTLISEILAGTLVTLGHNSEDCAEAGSHWDLSMIGKLLGGIFLGLCMILALPGSLFDCGTYWVSL